MLPNRLTKSEEENKVITFARQFKSENRIVQGV